MKDDERYWIELKIVSDYLNNQKADSSNNAGSHIHIGINVLGNAV